MDEAKWTAQHLIKAIQRLLEENIQHPGWHMEALNNLATIFKEATDNIQPYACDNPSSTDSTAPAKLQTAPHPHLCQTRNNTPGIINLEPQAQPSKPPRSEQPNSDGDRQTTEGAQALSEGATQHFGNAKDPEKVVPLFQTDLEPVTTHQSPHLHTPSSKAIPSDTPCHHPFHLHTPHIISQEALHFVCNRIWSHSTLLPVIPPMKTLPE